MKENSKKYEIIYSNFQNLEYGILIQGENKYILILNSKLKKKIMKITINLMKYLISKKKSTTLITRQNLDKFYNFVFFCIKKHTKRKRKAHVKIKITK
ncbi:hypothetical protein [Streptobacillus moniliformis]|uniref:hypothetical protein n=1 Tax=Streptobacillus moniliformis TaxID=34105 RepID=UPI0007E2E522|nr:hypothetical protein [Streptobacillus moniliformis]